MTVLVLFFLVMKKRIGLRERELISESISTLQIGGIVRMVKRVLFGTAAFELLGTVLLSIRFIPRFGFWPGIWNGLFHSVSAFCNAGFDLMGKIAPYTSLVPFQSDPLVNFVIMGLIACGGIGFVVWNDLWTNRLHFRRCTLHTKIMLTSTIALILGGAALLLVFEWNASMRDMPLGTRILASLFQSVTPRTAGYNTVDYAQFSDSGSLLTMILMFIGAGPGSTAGGIKVSTAVLLLLSVTAYIHGRDDIDVFGRRIDPSLYKKAFCTALFYFLLVLFGTMIIVSTQALSLRDVLFETFSAFGTVGLTRGITRDLSVLSRIIVILLMYSGRIGSLTVILSVSEKHNKSVLANPVEKIIVG
jgi:trk system potassium uptake protein TrkH